jgi:perosamine synthetase
VSNKPGRFLPYSRQSISQSDIARVLEVLESDFITQGSRVPEFEAAIADYVGARFAVACATGTAGLHLACQALDLKSGDRLVTSPITFVASANCAQFVGADTVFSDIDETTFCLSASHLEAVLQRHRPRVVVVVHFGGHPAELDELSQLKEKYGFKIIEDACHALGGMHHKHKIGASNVSEMSVFSFHPVKHITTGEGGIVTTNDEALYKRLIRYRTHGIHKDPDLFLSPELAFDEAGEVNPWYYEMLDLGYNYRITDLQCALGIGQLHKIDQFIERRRDIAARYNRDLADMDFVKTPKEIGDIKHAYHLYTLQVDFRELGVSRTKVMRELKNRGIGTQVLYIPIHLQPYYRTKYGYGPGMFPIAERYYDRCLSIPLFPDLSDSEVDWVVENLRQVLTEGTAS